MGELSGIPESMLIPLAARSIENNQQNPIVIDKFSENIFEVIEYPFENIIKSKATQTGISVRTFILDNIVNNFINQSANPLIINIGCGLDTRHKRLHIDKNKIPWVDIDLPEAIEIRKQFFQENDYYKMIDKSMFDLEWGHMIKEEQFYNEDMEILVIFEGVLMYFDELTIKQLLYDICILFEKHYLSLAIEFCSKLISHNTKHHKAVSQLSSKPTFKFGYNRLNDLDSIKPKNLKVSSEFNYFDYFHKRWELFGLCRFIPYLKNRLNNKIVILNKYQLN